MEGLARRVICSTLKVKGIWKGGGSSSSQPGWSTSKNASQSATICFRESKSDGAGNVFYCFHKLSLWNANFVTASVLTDFVTGRWTVLLWYYKPLKAKPFRPWLLMHVRKIRKQINFNELTITQTLLTLLYIIYRDPRFLCIHAASS